MGKGSCVGRLQSSLPVPNIDSLNDDFFSLYRWNLAQGFDVRTLDLCDSGGSNDLFIVPNYSHASFNHSSNYRIRLIGRNLPAAVVFKAGAVCMGGGTFKNTRAGLSIDVDELS